VNILLINYEYPPLGGGAATATRHLARAMRQSGNEITVLTSGYRDLRGVRREDGAVVVRCPVGRRRLYHARLREMAAFAVTAAGRLPALLAHRSIHGAVVFFALPCGPLGVLGRLLKGVPYVVSLRGGDVPGNDPSLKLWHLLLQPLRRMALRRAAGVVAASRSLQHMAARRDGIRVGWIPNGVDTRFYSPPAQKVPGRRVLFVGRFQAQKNLFYLLEQMDILLRETACPIEVHLAGDGPLGDSLKAFSRRLEIGDHIVWHGWCDRHELRRLYRQADCLVNTSYYEGMSNVILEAMACGLPVVASAVGGNAELVRPEQTGFLAGLERPAQLRQAVRKLIEDRRLAARMGRAGRRLAETRFSWERSAAAYLELLT
jgi:glycosyltransferase involved in cell wall biosynthesis